MLVKQYNLRHAQITNQVVINSIFHPFTIFFRSTPQLSRTWDASLHRTNFSHLITCLLLQLRRPIFSHLHVYLSLGAWTGIDHPQTVPLFPGAPFHASRTAYFHAEPPFKNWRIYLPPLVFRGWTATVLYLFVWGWFLGTDIKWFMRFRLLEFNFVKLTLENKWLMWESRSRIPW